MSAVRLCGWELSTKVHKLPYLLVMPSLEGSANPHSRKLINLVGDAAGMWNQDELQNEYMTFDQRSNLDL
jgi:hypothetical protein